MGDMADDYAYQELRENLPYSEWNPRGYKVKKEVHMPQEYTIKTWSAWMNDDGIVQDKYGNTKGSLTFEEDSSEPIDATFKNEPKVGDKKYGVVEEYTTRGGNTRRKFVRKDRPEQGQQQSFGGNKGGKSFTPKDDSIIRAQWAIGQAVQVCMAAGDLDNIETKAAELFDMVERIKARTSQSTTEDKPSGYDKFKAAGENIQKNVMDTFSDGTPIPTDEIPY